MQIDASDLCVGTLAAMERLSEAIDNVTLGTTSPASGEPEPSPPVTDDLAKSDHHVHARLRLAAFHATRLYPGPVGELISAELLAVEDWGYRLAGNSRAYRLTEHILAQLPEQR